MTRRSWTGECSQNHPVKKHVRSSVRDSFRGKGSTTLLLNDETHHVFSPPTGQASVRKWKEFLDDPEYGFARVAGFSGTCYVGDSYFPDVVSRYSLRSAIEDGRAKEVRYDVRDESLDQLERFQKYLQLHRENQKTYRDRKPISILITARVSGAQQLANEFVEFLARETELSIEEARHKVLVVTSSPGHAANVAQLPYVDRPESPVEWVFSVSMLTEGWDVQNVFQVIPHEKRAFNSKLLIAQVLGRGLRVPVGLTRPIVWVFNHARWSNEVADLVREVLEQERRLACYPSSLDPRDAYHLELHNLTYRTQTTSQALPAANGQVQLFTKGYVEFESQPIELERTTVFAGAVDNREHLLRTRVHYESYSVEDVVSRLRGRLQSIDLEIGSSYADEYPPERLKAVIEESLTRIGETRGIVSQQNLQHAYRAMGNVRRPLARTARIVRDAEQVVRVSTRHMRSRSVALSSFSKEATVFYDSASLELCDEEDGRALAELIDDESPYPKRASREVENLYRFKTPVNVVLTTHEPERRFVSRLFEPAIADRIAAWVKSPDTGFYEIAFTWRKGDHTRQGSFNPDVFIRLADVDVVLVVELKEDGDVSDEKKAKLRDAVSHFELVNAFQADVRYHVKFISPGSYDAFFQAIQDGNADGYVSALQAQLAV
jgi:type III restriction enzyme